MAKHKITTEWPEGTIEGYEMWPLARCSCGWIAINKDVDVIEDAIEQHTGKRSTFDEFRK